MKKIIFPLVFTVAFTVISCSDFLEVTPNAVLNQDQVSGPEQIDKLVTAAYSMLGNDHYDAPFSLWPWGNVRSDDAYKGGRDESDIQDYHFYEISENVLPTFGIPDALWFNMYVAISRTNAALTTLNAVSIEEFPQRDIRIGEMKFIRGHFYFMLKLIFKNVPFIDETVPTAEYGSISNVALSNVELWDKIAQDFESAYELLPIEKAQVGRADKYAAAAYLAKTRLYQAYLQDEQHNVTNIDAGFLEEVVKYSAIVMDSPYRLEDDFANNFLHGTYENGPEAIFSIQFSTDDGTMHGRLNFSDVLSVPQGLGCCDFHKPSQNLVNAFRTVDGLPDFEGYNNSDVNVNAEAMDPRLYHTVAIPGFPYKYNNTRTYEEDWNRNPGIYGVYASLKENVDPDSDVFINIDPFYGNSKNRIVIRYADVLLMRAEALIELNRHNEALELINEVRQRAQYSTSFIPYAPNLEVALYQPGVNCVWTQDFARQAMQWERRLELAMEGNRFFDLVRWGIADEVLNTFYAEETSKRTYYSNATFDKNQDEYIPIPQQQINFSKGLYEQNHNY